MNWSPRIARENDKPAIQDLIPVSVRGLQRAFYSDEQIEAALGSVFALDRQLILDETYFVVSHGNQMVGCGGWSRRGALFGGDHHRVSEDVLLDPKKDPARIRAFFVHPDWARRGVARCILRSCEVAIQSAQFSEIQLVATLSGEPLYAALGYAIIERFEVLLANRVEFPVVRMGKSLRRLDDLGH